MYTNSLLINNLESGKLLNKLPMTDYTKYCHLDLTEECTDDSVAEVKLALIVRTKDSILLEGDALYKSYVECLDIKCYLVGRDTKAYTNTYPNMLSRIADNLKTRYNLTPEQIVKTTILEPLGVLKLANTLYLPFELFVHETSIINSSNDLWVNIKDLQKDFESLSILDTILVNNLKIV